MSNSSNQLQVLGRRDPATGRASMVVSGDGREWPLPIPNRHLGAVEWGFRSLTVLATAQAILKEFTGQDHSEAIVRAFEADMVAHLPHDGFTLDEADVAAWLAHHLAS